jgi:hypothetical protein
VPALTATPTKSLTFAGLGPRADHPLTGSSDQLTVWLADILEGISPAMLEIASFMRGG